ncbi:hypothetical protein CR513_29181, partial [Mucuna pruriens]
MCKADSIAYTSSLKGGESLSKEKLPSFSEVFFIMRSEEIRRSVMLDKENSNTGSTIVTGKGPTERSTSEANDQDIPRILATSIMKRRKLWK